MQNVLDSLSTAGNTYLEEIRKDIKDTISMVTKTFAIPSAEAFADFVEEIAPENIGEAIDTAVTVMDALEDNPLAAKLKSELEDSLGMNFDNALQGAQLIMAGSNSPLMKICMAMITWPDEVDAFLAYARDLASYTQVISDSIAAMGGVNQWIDDKSVTLPASVKQTLQTANLNLGRSLVAPYDSSLYSLAMAQIETVVAELEAVPFHLNWVAGEVSAAAMKIATTGIESNTKSLYKSMSKAVNVLASKISDIVDTDITKSTSSTQTRQASMAKDKLKGVINQLSLPTVDQAAFIPQYLMVLNTIHNMLRLGRPTFDQPPAIFDRSGVTFDKTKLDAVVNLARKLLQYSLKPYRVDLFNDFYGRYITALDELEVSLNTTSAQIEDLWLQVPGVRDTLNGVMDVLNNTGFDAALDVLGTGDMGQFLALDNVTGTSVGMMMTAFDQISELGHSLNLFQLSTIIEGVRSEMKSNSDKKLTEQTAKKNEKAAKLKKQLTSLNAKIDSATELLTTVQGVLSAITSTLSQLGI